MCSRPWTSLVNVFLYIQYLVFIIIVCIYMLPHGGAFITSSREEKDMQSYILTVALQASFQKSL